MIKYIYRILAELKRRKLKSKCTLKGSVYFSDSSDIRLYYGSDKGDVVIGNHVKMYGKLTTQNHAKIICKDNVTIGSNTIVHAVSGVTFETGATISYNVTISDNNNHPVHPEDRKLIYSNPSPKYLYRSVWEISDNAPVVVGENAWIGAHAIILKGVTIGENSIVAMASVVTKDVPANSIVAGNPAKVVRTDIHLLPRKLVMKDGDISIL
ncbi:acyltransferase [Pedobacter faecalis]|uniref:acyltransferase n=1 Tax=Pedobacter faecalis TaxID=3041495 RepID=UPI00254E5153|nr:acyltransferase [Pedobacter sp. ELA7]